MFDLLSAIKPMMKTWRVLQFAPDCSTEKEWFDTYTGSVYGGQNSLDMMDTGLESGSYDFILSNHVLEHVADDIGAIREMLRVVGPNGLVCMTVPTPMFRWSTVDWQFADAIKNYHYRDYGSDFANNVVQSVPGLQGLVAIGRDPVTGIADHVNFFCFDPGILARLAHLWQRNAVPLVNLPHPSRSLTPKTSGVTSGRSKNHLEVIDGKLIRCSIASKDITFFVVDPADIIQRNHAAGGFYENEELEIISRYFRPGMSFVDVGANVGNHLVYVSVFLSPRKVFPIEPNPAAVPILESNIALNLLHPVADMRGIGLGLSDEPGVAVAVVPSGNLGGTRMKLLESGNGIRLVRGDDLLLGENVDFIKIDVEGMEIKTLKGLSGIIARCRPLCFIEVDNMNRGEFDLWQKQEGYEVLTSFKRYPWNENFLIAPCTS